MNIYLIIVICLMCAAFCIYITNKCFLYLEYSMYDLRDQQKVKVLRQLQKSIKRKNKIIHRLKLANDRLVTGLHE